MEQEQKKSFFSFFFIGMVIFTLIMAVLCIYVIYRVNIQKKELAFQSYQVREIRKKIQDFHFQELMERKKNQIRKGGHSQARVRQWLNQIVNRQGKLINMSFSERDDSRNLKKETYTVQLTHLTIHNLVNALYFIELIPGAKVDSLNVSRVKRSEYPWDAHFTVVIFSSKKSSKSN